MKEREKCEKRAITNLNAPNGSRDIPFQSHEIEIDGRRHFVDFLASFSLKYDVTDAILQDSEKMKVQYLRILFTRSVRNFAGCQNLAKEFHLISNFITMGTKIKVISLILKKQKVDCSNKRGFQKMI